MFDLNIPSSDESFTNDIGEKVNSTVRTRSNISKQVVYTQNENYFPYPEIRPHQKLIKEFVQDCFELQLHGIIDAANGTGKTISILSEVLNYQFQFNKTNQDKPLKIFYLTRTHNQASRVIEEIRQIHKELKSSTIRKPIAVSKHGKKAMCVNEKLLQINEGGFPFQSQCEMFKISKQCNFYDNFNKNKDDILKELSILTSNPLDAQQILEYCQPLQICPAEMNNLVLHKADLIAGSYLYLFDKEIRSVLLQSLDIDLSQLIIIIDECHNLPDTVLNLGSDFITKQQLFQALQELQMSTKEVLLEFVQKLLSLVEIMENRMNKSGKLSMNEVIVKSTVIIEIFRDLNLIEKDQVKHFFREMKQQGEKIKKGRAKLTKSPISHLERVMHLTEFWYSNRRRKDYIVTFNRSIIKNRPILQLRIRMLSPQKLITPILEQSHLSISMTGTLGQPYIYKSLSGLAFLDHDTLILPSPYNSNNIQVIVPNGITTKFQYRSDEMWQNVMDIIVSVMKISKKNAGFYVPSYQILNQFLCLGLEKGLREIGVESFISTPKMNSVDNDQMIAEFIEIGKTKQSLLIGVMGGRVSEGTDFDGEKMEVIFTLGIPYPPQTPEMEHRIKYFDGIFKGKGWDIVYGSPPWYEFTQASGRGLRSLSDRVFIVAMDERILCKRKGMNNLNRLPLWMRENIEETVNDLVEIQVLARNFFNS